MSFWDVHSHIQFKEFEHDYTDVLSRMEEAGVSAFLVGTDFASSRDAIEKAKEKTNLFATVGLHPNDNREETFDRDAYKELAKEEKVVAIGECGLDYFRGGDTEEEKKRQKNIFAEHIEIGALLDKPLMIHSRDAHSDVLDILTSFQKKYGERVRGNIHFFTSDYETAKKYFDIGCTVSFTGVITFTKEYDMVVENSPLSSIMTETDCPYATPAPFRGKRNEPAFIPLIVDRIAEIKKIHKEKCRDDISQTVERFFLV